MITIANRLKPVSDRTWILFQSKGRQFAVDNEGNTSGDVEDGIAAVEFMIGAGLDNDHNITALALLRAIQKAKE